MARIETTDLWLVGKAADAVGVARPTLYKAVKEGVCPSLPLGSEERVVLLKDVEAYAATLKNVGRPRKES